MVINEFHRCYSCVDGVTTNDDVAVFSVEPGQRNEGRKQ